MRWPARVVITEVGPRDGLQNESRIVPVDQRIALVEALAEAGLQRIEAGAFVSPRAVPAMADSARVMAGVRRKAVVTYVGLVPNERGARDAAAAGVDEVAVVVSASESHNRENLNRSIAETLGEIRAVAAAVELPWSAYISTAFGCPFEGAVDPVKVMSLAQELCSIGASEVALGDTIGVADPRQVYELTERFLSELRGVRLRLHFHDTYGRALANVVAAMQAGASAFDASVGGLGGCPYAPGASGNVATEDLVAMLDRMGVETGVDLEALTAVARWASEVVARPLDGRVVRAMAGRTEHRAPRT